MSKLWFNDGYLFLDSVVDATALEEHTGERGFLFDKRDDAHCVTVVPATNLLAFDSSI